MGFSFQSRGFLLSALIAGAAVVGGCEPGTANDDPPSNGGGGATGQGGGFDLTGGGSDGGGGMDNGCIGVEQEATYKPLNLYIMMDASSSMAGTKWEDAKTGLSAFLNDPDTTDVDAAISFFPRPAGGPPVCDQNAYKEPVVDFGPLPANGPAMMAAIDARSPDGFSSPMYPALGGAMLRGIELAENNPDKVSAVLLVTDGKPEGPAETCSGVDPEEPSEVAALAAAGASFNPPVRTFIVGLPGVDVTIADQIAAAGGTDEAIVVGTTDTANKFAQALEKARGELLDCTFEIPAEVEEGQVGLGHVNVSVTPGGGDPTLVPRNDECEGPGWRFDNPSDPKSIILCPETCDLIDEDFEAAIAIVLGCPTVH